MHCCDIYWTFGGDNASARKGGRCTSGKTTRYVVLRLKLILCAACRDSRFQYRLHPWWETARRLGYTEVFTAKKLNKLQNVQGSAPRACDEVSVPTPNDFRRELYRIMLEAQNDGKEFVLVNAGELHTRAGGRRNRNDCIASCCQVMRNEAYFPDMVVEAPPSGFGATLTIRYHLPRRHDWDKVYGESR